MKLAMAAIAAALSVSQGLCQVGGQGQAGGDPRTGPVIGRPHGGGIPDKSGDTVLTALIRDNLDKFKQLRYTDPGTGITLEYNLFVPEGGDPSGLYPLMMFIGDASTAGRDVTAPLTQGYGGLVWATPHEQGKHPSFVLVPQYSSVTVNDGFATSDEVEVTIRLIESLCGEYPIDRSRLYTTGQSMGGMMSMHFNVEHPGFFAASYYVGCQWDTSRMAGFADDSFIYVVGGGDEKASRGMADLVGVLEGEGKRVSQATWSARLPVDEQERATKALLDEGNNANCIVFTKGSVLPESGVGMEHMCSFDFAYRLEAARDWIYRQRLK